MDYKFRWPIITPADQEAVSNQLSSTVSIYDNSGVFGRVEKKLASWHNVPH